MAIYHLTANIISRARGQSAVAAAAYRSGVALRDERYGVTHNHTSRRAAPLHSEILAPAEAPPWVWDRAVLWNRVEAAELRKDSQLARVIEVGLPIELTADESLALVRDYIALQFTSRGMVADFCIRRDNPANPGAQIVLTLRGLTATGFGPKERKWNGKSNLLEWRAAWADRANEHLARAGHGVRIDHRTLEAQQIELTPARRVGFGRARHVTDRAAEQQRIAHENGAIILDDPTVALRALTHQRPTFTEHDLIAFLRSRTDGSAQYEAAYIAVRQCPDLVALNSEGGIVLRFTSRDMLEAAKSLNHRAVSMANRRGHGIALDHQSSVVSRFSLRLEQQQAVEYLVGEGDAKAIAVAADMDNVLLVTAARHAWEAGGLHVSGVASGPAAAYLEQALGARPKTLDQWENAWQQSRDLPARDAVLLVDGADMIGLKPLQRILAVADKGRAKVVLMGDSARMAAMREESPFHRVLLEIGYHRVVV